MTQRLEWLESYSVGVARFDEAHNRLVDILNAFSAACTDNHPMPRQMDLLLELVRYAHFHFRDEEDLMRKTGYPELEAHRATHDQLFERILRFTHDYFFERVEQAELLQFLMDWLLGHILAEDMRYKEHFARAGVT
jgi:hemerythrin